VRVLPAADPGKASPTTFNRAMGGYMRGFLVAALALVSAGVLVSEARADSVNLTFEDSGPTGTVRINGSAVPANEQGITVYAGVLNWHDTFNVNSKLYTYCIDLAHTISTGSQYNFDIVNLDSLFSTKVVHAIENLWNDNRFGTAGQIDTASHVAGISALQAAQFQIALWDIISNSGGGSNDSLSAAALQFAGGSLSPSELTAALDWANDDYTADPPAQVFSLQALVATSGDGQNQAIYLGGPARTEPVPLPLSWSGGLALLGLFGVVSYRRKHGGLLAFEQGLA